MVLLLFAQVATADEDPDGPCQIPRDATREQKCEYITDNEECEVDSLIDYLEVYYCTDVSQGAAYAIMATFVVWWCILIAVLGSTADEYFCPPADFHGILASATPSRRSRDPAGAGERCT